MPEGDTVWLHARQLHEALGGSTIVSSDFRLPELATADLGGHVVREVVSRGKHLLIRTVAPQSGSASTRAEWSLHSHLRMEGTWAVFEPGQAWRRRPAHTIRVVLQTARATAVGFHLHDVALLPTSREDELVDHLGPDLLGPGWDAAEAIRRLAAQPDRAIATALLDQRNLAGIGNLYKAELCFLRGISPWAQVGDVPDLPGVVALARRLLYANRERWPQITTGDTRKGRQTYVFERAGQPCLRCGTLVRRARHGGDLVEDRITYWCPTCQPGHDGAAGSAAS